MTCRLHLVACVSLWLVVGSVGHADAQWSSSTKYDTGQSLQPVYEGWEQHPDGSYSMWFGYFNRNWNQRLIVPIGPDNNIQPGNPDQGQPTVFETVDRRRLMFAFKIDLPADWPKDRDLVWTLTANGMKLTATGSLWPTWLVGDDIIASNRGTLRIFDAESTNTRPVVAENATGGTVAVGKPFTLSVGVTDDGLPRRTKPGEVEIGGKGRAPLPDLPAMRDALRVEWLQWRGPGVAEFHPYQVRVLDANGKYSGTGGKAVTTVTFNAPGVYVLKPYVQDMSLFALPPDVTVTVTGAPAAQPSVR